MTIEQALRTAVEHHDAGRLAEAESAYRAVLQHVPTHALTLHLLGVLLNQTGRHEEAELLLRRAIELEPGVAECHAHLGNALTEQNRAEEAIACYRRAIELDSGDPDTHYNFGVALADLRRFEEAIAAYERAIALRPDFAEAHAKLGIALLTLGQFERGWGEYEWRLRWTRPNARGPVWDGSPLDGKTIVLEAEQGSGDTIQFLRYAPLVAERGGRVIIACPKPLHRLAAGVEGVAGVCGIDESVPDAVVVPMPSLPRLLGTIPSRVPYVSAPPIELEGERKVGLVWAGNAAQRDDRWRSCRLSDLAPLGEVARVRFYSLQKGGAAEQLREAPFEIVDLAGRLNDWCETASAVAGLDLIITVDTAVAHLAGAMAKPVWNMLFATSDWRWGLEREDSPWYPTMRLFRQSRRGEWGGVVRRIVDELKGHPWPR